MPGGCRRLPGIGSIREACTIYLLMRDEPSLGLAPILAEEVFRVITEINRLGVTVLLVEQNTQHALALAHRGFVMELGRIALSGSGAELLSNDSVRKAYLGL